MAPRVIGLAAVLSAPLALLAWSSPPSAEAARWSVVDKDVGQADAYGDADASLIKGALLPTGKWRVVHLSLNAVVDLKSIVPGQEGLRAAVPPITPPTADVQLVCGTRANNLPVREAPGVTYFRRIKRTGIGTFTIRGPWPRAAGIRCRLFWGAGVSAVAQDYVDRYRGLPLQASIFLDAGVAW